MLAARQRSVPFVACAAPAAVILISIGLALSPVFGRYPDLAMGIIYDLTLTAPLVYLVAIWNKPVPRITAVPVFVAGIVLASLLIPEQQQLHLNIVKTWLLPVVELAVVSVVLVKVRRTVKAYHSKTGSDFYVNLRMAALETLEFRSLAMAFSTEIAVFYYALFCWRRKPLQPNEFTGYRESGSIALLAIIIFLVLAETFVIHILLARWSPAFAWVLSLMSLYTGLQLFGHLKALVHRPSVVLADALHLKYGLFGDVIIPLCDVESVELLKDGTGEPATQLVLLNGLEASNILLRFKQEQTIEKVYGLTKKCSALRVYADDSHRFVEQVKFAISGQKPS